MTAIFTVGCATSSNQVTYHGQIKNYDPNREYEIKLLQSSESEYSLLGVIEPEEIEDGRFEYTYVGDIDYNTVMEISEDDTVRAILVSGEGDYIKNPMTNDIFYYGNIKPNKSAFIIDIKNIKIELNRDPEVMLDLNMKKMHRPVLEVSDDYKHVKGRLDTLPPEARLMLITDGGYARQRFEFMTPEFEIKTDYKITYIDIYIKSIYGWKRHLQRYDIEKIKPQ